MSGHFNFWIALLLLLAAAAAAAARPKSRFTPCVKHNGITVPNVTGCARGDDGFVTNTLRSKN
jgi:hypothetical protein